MGYRRGGNGVVDKQIEFKPMVYDSKSTFDILADGEYKGYRFFIISYGTHPCAYVALPKTSKFYGKHYEDRIFDNLNPFVHGGLTCSGRGLLGKKTYLIGWDYVALGDFVGYSLGSSVELTVLTKEWTTEGIYEQVKEVIDEIIKEEACNA